MPFAFVRDLDLYYELGGAPDGPPVLFVSGTGGDLRTKPNVFDGPLAARCSVLAYDQRGLGQTSKPDAIATMADYALDAAALLDSLGEPWSGAGGVGVGVGVVGASFGGMVAQELAIRRPDLVSRLVLCCTSSGGDGGASYPLHELSALDPSARRRTQLAISDVRFDEAWQDDHPSEADRLLGRMQATDEAAADAAAGDAAREIGARRQLEARAGHDTWDRLGSIAAPTLVCAGRYDGIAPVSNSSALAERIPRASMQVFEGGHLFLLQDRSAWTSIVNFLTA
jgi:3-oxoadipate enol-lactonase